jgi:hypothetical protein
LRRKYSSADLLCLSLVTAAVLAATGCASNPFQTPANAS